MYCRQLPHPPFSPQCPSITSCHRVITGLLFLLLALIDNTLATQVNLPYVTCGSVIRLVNANFLTRLHSHDIKYGSGSGQQSVTGTDDTTDANSYWQVKGSQGQPCSRGEAIACGANVRLEHLNTRKNLHSHLFPSPLSGGQEVSAFGEEGEGDTGDNWTINCNSDFWERDENIRLKHIDTEKWLSVSGRTYGRPISGQMEVVGSKYPDASSYWKTTEGIYVKPDDSSSPGKKKEEGEHDEL